MHRTPSVITIGLDGATWRLLDRWVDDGTLPNLAALLDRGVRSDLRSCHPPVTSPNWKCLSTGRNPGALDVYWWEVLTETADGYEISRPTSTSYRQPELWDYLGHNDILSAVVNMPTTHPPTDISGVMVSGGPNAEEQGFTTPQSLESTLRERYDYRCLPRRLSLLGDGDEAAVEEAIDLVGTRFEVAEHLGRTRDVDYLNVTVYLSNVFQHFFWDGPATEALWRRIDDGIGRLVETFEDATFLLASDHGSNETDLKFYINLWLAEQGYLETTGSDATIGPMLYRLGLHRDRLSALATKIGVKSALKRLLSRDVIDSVPTKTGSVRLEGKNDRIDWEASDAFAFGQGPVYVFDDDKREEIKAALADLTHDGKHIASTVHDGADVYSGPYAETAPDLVIEQNEGVHISNSLGDEDIFVDPDHWRAENEMTGIFAAAGPDIDTDVPLDTVSILDFAPSVLALLDTPVASSMEGTVLPVVDRPDVSYASYDFDARSDTAVEGDRTRERLSDLGYLE
ncbi:nucleotide pyrophosphatase [Halapricum sp. CBA1109]|uniref:alkaline phosphatase family protein n=1 Tax=Halapricum sp. CBA1109 TaxID=2668068 RepID=UPI0012FCDCF0|nr:nucleotide pyrophosphatase [Halapricum sp. CBA1109]